MAKRRLGESLEEWRERNRISCLNIELDIVRSTAFLVETGALRIWRRGAFMRGSGGLRTLRDLRVGQNPRPPFFKN